MSMYKIGNTTYYVETIFNPQAESLDELIERLIGKDIENILRQIQGQIRLRTVNLRQNSRQISL